jgi:G3E family GTPase
MSAVNNENFRDQLACADIIVANKEDRATAESHAALDTWWQHFGGKRQRVYSTQGKIDNALLDLPRLNQAELPASADMPQPKRNKGSGGAEPAEHQRWRRNLNSGQGHQACGWIFDADTVFDTIGILEWARLAPVDRVKGIMRTQDGLVRINRQGGFLH